MAIRVRFNKMARLPWSNATAGNGTRACVAPGGALAAFPIVAILAFAPPATAAGENAATPANQCVACHQVEHLSISLGHSLNEWQASAHGRGGVTCEKCHGGNASAADMKTSHVGVLPASDPASKVSPHNLAATCGSCHAKEYAAYKGTVHAKEFKEDSGAATCVTCHGSMATSYPSPTELSARCTTCHERPVQARAALSWLSSARKQLLRARRTLDEARSEVPEWYEGATVRFHELEKDFEKVSLKWHTFNMEDSMHESRNLLELGKLLDEEGHLKLKISREKAKKK